MFLKVIFSKSLSFHSHCRMRFVILKITPCYNTIIHYFEDKKEKYLIIFNNVVLFLNKCFCKINNADCSEQRECVNCGVASTRAWRSDALGHFLCDTCSIGAGQHNRTTSLKVKGKMVKKTISI